MADVQKYEAVIGLEVHVQLATKSKMFCRCDNQSDGAKPNTNVCPVCLAMPGTLPVPNRQAVEWALKASLALGCEIPTESKFDRKQYFYPDLPKGYQISQFDQPFGGPGTFEFDVVSADGSVESKSVGITRLHLEEDAGKLTHPAGADHSLVDLNRAGTPLAEIVTEPDLRSPAEAKAFMQELRLLMRTIGVSDADMEKGHLRADANISVRPMGQQELGAKAELKNLNSFRFVEKGLEAEFARQVELLEKGEKVDQETRGYDEKTGKTVSQRGKEEAHDYRYFPEPDIPPLAPHKLISEVKASRTPNDYRKLLHKDDNHYIASKRLIELALKNSGEIQALIKTIEEWAEEPIEPVSTHMLEKKFKPVEDAKIKRIPSLWDLFRNYEGIKDEVENQDYAGLRALVLAVAPHTDKIRGPQAKAIALQWKKKNGNLDDLINSYLENQMSDQDLEATVAQAIKDNPKPAADFQAGNENAAQAIVGSVMAATKGGADPRKVSQLVRQKLSKS